MQNDVQLLKPRVLQIFEQLITTNNFINISQLADHYGVQPRTIRYDAQHLASLCRTFHLSLERKRQGMRVSGADEDLQAALRWLKESQHSSDSTNKAVRFYRILGALLDAEEPMVVKQLRDVAGVSPRTMYSDLDRVEEWLTPVGLRLVRKPHFGFQITGEEILFRFASLKLFSSTLNLLDEPPRNLAHFLQQRLEFLFPSYSFSEDSLVHATATVCTALPYAHRRTQIETIAYLSLAAHRIRRGHTLCFDKELIRKLMENREFPIAQQLAQGMQTSFSVAVSEEESIALLLQINGVFSDTLLSFQVTENECEDPCMTSLVQEMLQAVDSALGMALSNDKDLQTGLAFHVKPVVYRILFGIPIHNDFLHDIQSNHPLAYYSAVLAGKVLEDHIGKAVCQSEIGFLALHFGAALERQMHQLSPIDKPLRALVVCAGSVGTGKILASRLESELPFIRVVATVGKPSLSDSLTSLNPDIIISSVPLESPSLPHIIVQPLLPTDDVNRIVSWLSQKLSKHHSLPWRAELKRQIRSIIASQFEITKMDLVDLEIDRFLLNIAPFMMYRPVLPMREHRHSDLATKNIDNTESNGGAHMLDLLTEKLLKAQVNAHNPMQVIDICGNLLIQSGFVEPSYVDAMKRSLEENGPYMVIVPGVALLHARPENGVKKVCIAMVTLKEPIPFGHKDNDPVRLAIAFGAIDKQNHLNLLADLMQLLSDTSTIAEICQAADPSQILRILRRVFA